MTRCLLACVALLFGTSTASAGIIGVTGDFLVVSSATAAYIADPYNDPIPAPIRIWIEQEPITLASDVVLDTDLADSTLRYVISGPGAAEVAFGPGSGPTVSAGTSVNVYYAYFDPVNDSAMGTVTFDSPVLGIVAYTSRLQFSDFLRVPGAPYPANPAFNDRGWENTEWGQLSADRLTLTFSGTATSPADQFRIITGVSDVVVPEPATWLLVLSGLSLAARRRV